MPRRGLRELLQRGVEREQLGSGDRPVVRGLVEGDHLRATLAALAGEATPRSPDQQLPHRARGQAPEVQR